MAYRRGREWEYRVARKLRDEGYFVIRAAGSKPIDLIAIKDGQVMLVECKTKKPSPSEVEELRRLGRELGVKIALAVRREALKVIYEPDSESPSASETQGEGASPKSFEDQGHFASLNKAEAPKLSVSPRALETHL